MKSLGYTSYSHYSHDTFDVLMPETNPRCQILEPSRGFFARVKMMRKSHKTSQIPPLLKQKQDQQMVIPFLPYKLQVLFGGDSLNPACAPLI